MCALAHAHATGMCGHDFPKGTRRVEGEGFALIMRRRESAQRAKKRIPIRVSAFLELLGRFELPTSSLPIHFRLSRLDFACLRLSPESRINTRFSDSACPFLT